jgi:hypothetical protein
MLPATYDLVVPQRASFRQRFKIPLDFTDREVCAQIWRVQPVADAPSTATGRNVRVSKVLELGVDWIDRALVEDDVTKGVFELYAAYTDTAALEIAELLEWDLLVIDGTSLHDGERTYWLHGAVTIDPGLSESTGD